MINSFKKLVEDLPEDLIAEERAASISDVRRAQMPSEAIIDILATMDMPSFPHPQSDNDEANGFTQADLYRRALRHNRGPIAVAHHNIEMMQTVYGLGREQSGFAILMATAIWFGMHESMDVTRNMAAIFLATAEAIDAIDAEQHRDAIGEELGCASVMSHQWEAWIEETAEEVTAALAKSMVEFGGSPSSRINVQRAINSMFGAMSKADYVPAGVERMREEQRSAGKSSKRKRGA